MNELLYKLTEKLEMYENGEITSEQLNDTVKASNAICSVIKTHIVGEQHMNRSSAMEFITAGSTQTKQISANNGWNVMDVGSKEIN